MNPSSSRLSPYAWFVLGASVWSLASSLNHTLFSWLVVGVLREEPRWVGVAQMFQQAPFLVFLLLGGLLADRVELRRLMIGLHLAAAVAAAVLAALVARGYVLLAVLLPHALCWGTIQAFFNPTRDAMVSHVSRGDMMRSITWITLLTFSAWALGAKLGVLVDHIGVAGALTLEAAIFALGVAVVWRWPRVVPLPRPSGEGALAGLRQGLRAVVGSRALAPVALLVACNGLLFMGPFQVLGPILVREAYAGGVGELAALGTLFPVGTIAGSLVMLLRRGQLHRGGALLGALVGVALCLLAIAAHPPYWAFLSLIFVWGALHAVFLNTSRALFQQLAEGPARGRILSVHSLGLLGMAPLSHLGSGLIAEGLGAEETCVLAAVAMLAAALAAGRGVAAQR